MFYLCVCDGNQSVKKAEKGSEAYGGQGGGGAQPYPRRQHQFDIAKAEGVLFIDVVGYGADGQQEPAADQSAQNDLQGCAVYEICDDMKGNARHGKG